MSKNSISGRFVVAPDAGVITIPLTDTQARLATDKNPVTMNDSWDKMCVLLMIDGFMDIRGSLHIDTIVIDGVSGSFH
jgi:hypothetical protein